MQQEFERSALLWGNTGSEKLNNAHVAVFGAGGVGGYAIEALARAGIGNITIIDNDIIAKSNINRQILATQNNIGEKKVISAKNRILSINPNCNVFTYDMFYLPENAHEIQLDSFTYIIDAIDTVSAKISLIERATQCNIPIISAMGCGNKFDPSQFCVSDIFKTDTDPLARVIRRELKKRNIKSLKVVYSKEPPITPLINNSNCNNTNTHVKQTPGSVSFVPSVAGLILAGTVIREIACV